MRGKVFKIIGIVIGSIVLLSVFAFVLIDHYLSGGFNKYLPHEIATYQSPDKQYVLVFDQLGNPEWPFGATDVRLTLKKANGKKIRFIDTFIQDDGCNADKHNIKKIEWSDDGVVVTLYASEMEDKTVSIDYE